MPLFETFVVLCVQGPKGIKPKWHQCSQHNGTSWDQAHAAVLQHKHNGVDALVCAERTKDTTLMLLNGHWPQEGLDVPYPD